jgi:hypothetical protein
MAQRAAAASANVVAAAVAYARHRQEEEVRTSGDLWRAFARQMSLPPAGITATGLPFLDGTLDGVRFRLRCVRDEQGWAHTQALADAVANVNAAVGVYTSPHGFLDWVKSHFEEDIEIGDPPFDRAFVIRARPTEAAASLLSYEVRHLLMAFLSHAVAGLTYKEGVVGLQWRGVERDARVLEHAIRLVTLAARWNPHAGALRPHG